MTQPTGQAGNDRKRIDHPLGVGFFHPANSATELADILFRQYSMTAPGSVAHEFQSLLDANHRQSVWMKGQSLFCQEYLDKSNQVPQPGPVIIEEDKVVTVANVPAYALVAGDKMVQVIEEPVGKPLAGQVADWNTPSAFQGSQ